MSLVCTRGCGMGVGVSVVMRTFYFLLSTFCSATFYSLLSTFCSATFYFLLSFGPMADNIRPMRPISAA